MRTQSCLDVRSGEMYNGLCMDNFQYVNYLGPGCMPGCLPPTPPPPPDQGVFPPLMTPCAVPRPDPIAAPAPPGMCDHNSGESCCSVGGSSYLDTSTPDLAWGSAFTVEECYGPSGPRSWTQLTHVNPLLNPIGGATTWGGANYRVNVHSCCLQPGARCGLILQIHGFFQQPGDMESATDLAGHAGAEQDSTHDSCDSQRFIVVEAQSRSDGAIPGDRDKHWRPTWADEDAGMHAEFMRHTAALYDVDRAHIHVTGYSEGSFATWNLLCKHSELVCSIASAEFPPYGYENPSGDGCRIGSTGVAGGSELYDATAAFGGRGVSFGNYDVAPTCFADAHSSSPDIEPRSILFQFGQRETICGDSGASAGLPTMEETRALVGQLYLGHDLAQMSYDSPSPPGWTGDWRAYILDGVGQSDGGQVVLETITHPYDNAALPIGIPVDGVVWPGHCLPNKVAGVAFPSCAGAAAYTWGEEVVRFFRQNPCSAGAAGASAQSPAQEPPPPPAPEVPGAKPVGRTKPVVQLCMLACLFRQLMVCR